MQTTIKFTKVSGAGNDFVLIDNLGGEIHIHKPSLARALCSRHFGVGADGLIVIERSDTADFLMDYYNADGSHGGMCGNGGRCAARYAFLNRISGPTMSFEALGHVYHAEMANTQVKLQMKDVPLPGEELKFVVGGELFVGHFIDTGSPHVVVVREDLDALDVSPIGRRIRNEPRLLPEGANVNFVQAAGKDKITNRTYERGVESETLACGTGAVASAIVATMKLGLAPPITVSVRSGEELIVHFRTSDKTITDVYLQGSAHILFDGSLIYNDISGRIEPSEQKSTRVYSGRTK
jgi:diaminopimelate epimerase